MEKHNAAVAAGAEEPGGKRKREILKRFFENKTARIQDR
jgi:hypothetical protein